MASQLMLSETETQYTLESVKSALVQGVQVSSVGMYRVRLVCCESWEDHDRRSYVHANSLDELASKILSTVERLQVEAVERCAPSSAIDELGEPEENGEHECCENNEFFSLLAKDGIVPILDHFAGQPTWRNWKYGTIEIESVIPDEPVYAYRLYS